MPNLHPHCQVCMPRPNSDELQWSQASGLPPQEKFYKQIWVGTIQAQESKASQFSWVAGSAPADDDAEDAAIRASWASGHLWHSTSIQRFSKYKHALNWWKKISWVARTRPTGKGAATAPSFTSGSSGQFENSLLEKVPCSQVQSATKLLYRTGQIFHIVGGAACS